MTIEFIDSLIAELPENLNAQIVTEDDELEVILLDGDELWSYVGSLYLLDFLMLTDEAKEKQIEQGLMEHLQKFLLELGEGFAFVGRPYPLCKICTILIFYFFHLKLRCYVVVELKVREFEVKDTG